MKRYLRSWITAGLLGAALCVTACGDGTDNEATTAQPDLQATSTANASSSVVSTSDSVAVAWPHDWTAERVGGGQFDAGDYEEQDLVLWFWAPW